MTTTNPGEEGGPAPQVGQRQGGELHAPVGGVPPQDEEHRRLPLRLQRGLDH